MTQKNGMSYIILFLCTVERRVFEIILTKEEKRCIIKKL